MVIDVACGKKLKFERMPHYDQSYVRFILTNEDIDKYESVKKNTSFKIIRSVVKERNINHDVLNSSDRDGYYIL